MRKDKLKAIELRKAGKSYREINKILGVPLGTLSEWFSSEKWSSDIRASLSESRRVGIKELHRIRGVQLKLLYEEARTEAEKEFRFFKNSSLFVAGLVAYWGEGDKVSKYRCRVSNSDPGIIRVYLAFLDTVCGVPAQKITASLLIYPDLDEKSCISYWKAHTGIPAGNFRKTMVIQGRHKTRRLSYGVCSVVVSSRYLKEKMLVWLRLIAKEFPNAAMV